MARRRHPPVLAVVAFASLAVGCAGTDPARIRISVEERAFMIDAALAPLVRRMELRDLAGQMLMVSLEPHPDGRALTDVGPTMAAMLSELQPGAVVLFAWNLTDMDQTLRLTGDLAGGVKIPPFVAIDQEGGRVSRLTSAGLPATPIPSARATGRALAPGMWDPGASLEADQEAVRRAAAAVGRVMGEELRSLGFTLNLAPVADVTPPGGGGPIDEDGRSFGWHPATVGSIVAGVVAGLQEAGVASVVKHFPGHGSAGGDTHDGISLLARTREELIAVDLVPFRAAIEEGVAGVMTAHLSVPAVTGDMTPATLSAEMVDGILRRDLDFQRIVITDALNMDALASGRTEEELALASIRAGADILLKPRDPVAVRNALLEAVGAGELRRGRLEESVIRILREKYRFGLLGILPPRDPADPHTVLGSREHRETISQIMNAASGD